MESVLEYYLLFTLVISLIYFFIMAGWYTSWKLYITSDTKLLQHPATMVTIILPVRNEENNIIRCLDCLSNQNYPNTLLEIIVSDDFSSDQTVAVCRAYISSAHQSKHQINLIMSSEDFGTGKKAAIAHAINHSRGQLILTTDADCTMGPDWVKSFVSIFESSNPSMITGFVKIAPTPNFFSAMQALEFLSLSASSAMTVIRNKPLMCNGANLAFSKSAFLEAGGYRYGGVDATGDDTYLMLKIAEKNPASVLFNNNRSGIVTTKPEANLGMLVTQRIRWASKIRNYKEQYIKRTGIFIFALNFLIISLIVLALAGAVSWKIVFAIWMLKVTADLFVLIPGSVFASQKYLLLLILPAGLLYPFYSMAGMLLSLGKFGYRWKDRKYQLFF